MSYPEFLIDKRVIQRNVAKGLVDAKEYEKLLTRLPDVQHNADACAPETAEEPDELDESDE